jgi:hypothetical protein
MVGNGSQYQWTGKDPEENPFDRAKTYKLHLHCHVRVKDF